MIPSVRNVYSASSVMLICIQVSLSAQVPVHKEPMHRMVIENEYIRLLDVWIEPGDTTEFHVHSTPSLFTHMTNRDIHSQVKGESWVRDTTEAGKIWYDPFKPDKLIHRVTNSDKEAFHVIAIELVSAYDKDDQIPDVPQSLPLIMDNVKAYAYRINSKILEDLKLVTPGPMIAILLAGGPVTFHNEMMATSSEIQDGQFAYLDTGTFLSFTLGSKSQVDMILFEIK